MWLYPLPSVIALARLVLRLLDLGLDLRDLRAGRRREAASWRSRCGTVVLDYYRWLAALKYCSSHSSAGGRAFPDSDSSGADRLAIAYVVFNGKYLGLLLGYVTALWIRPARRHIRARLDFRAWPWWLQFAVLLIAINFLEVVHPRSPPPRPVALETTRCVAASSTSTGWATGAFRWAETLVYNELLYAPTALLGVRGEVAHHSGRCSTR